MIITSIEIYKLSIPMEPFVIATGTMEYAQNIFVRIRTNTTIHGVGECSAFPMIVGETQNTCFEIAKDFAKIWNGKNPLAIAERMGELDQYIAGNTTIKSAFDMALYDLASKNAKIPLYKFLGGKKREAVTDITLGLGTAMGMAIKALELKGRGAEVLKIKLGTTPEEDVDRIREIRKAVGFDIPLRIDANQGWTFEEAIYALQEMAPFKIQFCEQPMRTWDDNHLVELRHRTTVPIMADESVYSHRDAERLCSSDSCDYLNIKFSKSGGILEAMRIHEVSERYNIPCMIGGMLESRLALSAKLQFAYAAPYVKFFDLDTCMVGHLQDPVLGGMQYDGYRVEISDEWGIGADIDQSFLDQCESFIVQ